MYKILLFVPALILFSCNSHPNDNGGRCDYVTDTVGATIVRMDSTNTPYPDIVLTLPAHNGMVDTLRYTNNTSESPTWEVCTERGYSVGVKLKTVRQIRTTGECDPVIYSVKKELFK